jgi:mercuric ion transport protein
MGEYIAYRYYSVLIMNKKLFTTGLIGTTVTALCCFTPLLVVTLGALGLSAWVAGLDYVLFPLLAPFVGVTLYALFTKETSL